MAYGTIKVDTITFTDAGVDKSVTISGLVQNPTFSGNITVTGTVSGNTIQGQTVSGATITGGAAAFTTVTGGVATITSGVFALGSASNPSISFNGDANSGLYSPGADQVAVATNGTGRLFVSSAGTVGIDTNETNFNGQGSPLIVGNGSGNQGLTIYSGNNNFGTVQFADTATTGADSYRGVVAYKHGDEYMYFSTNATEKMRITSAGLVGIGTISPGATLSVFSAASASIPAIQIASSGSFANNDIVRFQINGLTNGFRMFQDASSNVRYSFEGGSVGIGTTSPGTKLEVAGSAAFRTDADVRLTLGSSGSIGSNDSNFIRAATDQVIYNAATSSGRHSWELAGSEKARIDSSGRLGVGTSSPANTLHVNSGAVGTSTLLESTGSGSYLGIKNSSGQWTLGATTTSFILENSGGTALTVDSSRRVGIGSTSFGGKLTVKTSSSNGAPVAWGDGQLVVTAGDGTTAPGFGISTNTSDNSVSLSALTPGTGWNNLHLRAAQTIFYKSDAASNEVGRWDASGRLLIGTSTSPTDSINILAKGPIGGGGGGGCVGIGYAGLSGPGNGNTLGVLRFTANGNSTHAEIRARQDGATWTDGSDQPSRLEFSTTADGASSPTERMRIPNGGGLSVGGSVNPNALTQTTGIRLGDNTIASHSFTNITTSPVNIANGVGIGGLAFVQAFNTGNGAQYTGIVMWRSGIVAVVSESNALGFGLTYTVSGSALYLQTASGTISGSVITFAG
jgi:hypothetical protein